MSKSITVNDDEELIDILERKQNAIVTSNSLTGVGVGDVIDIDTKNGEKAGEIKVDRTAECNAIEAHKLTKVFGANLYSDKPYDVVDKLSDVSPNTKVTLVVFTLKK